VKPCRLTTFSRWLWDGGGTRFFVAGSILVIPLLAASAVFLRLWITAIELNITRCLQQANVYNLAKQIQAGTRSIVVDRFRLPTSGSRSMGSSASN